MNFIFCFNIDFFSSEHIQKNLEDEVVQDALKKVFKGIETLVYIGIYIISPKLLHGMSQCMCLKRLDSQQINHQDCVLQKNILLKTQIIQC